MFGRLFGPTTTNIDNTKTVQLREDKEDIEQSIWRQFLIHLDLKLSPFHDHDDIIVITSPYSPIKIFDSSIQPLNKLNLICVSAIVMDYLFRDDIDLIKKIEVTESFCMNKIKQLVL